MEWVEKVGNELRSTAALSHYSPDVAHLFAQLQREFRSRVLTTRQAEPQGHVMGVDISGAYTGVMAELPRLSVIWKFDNMQELIGRILSHAVYLVWVSSTDPILFPKEMDRVSGTVFIQRRIKSSSACWMN